MSADRGVALVSGDSGGIGAAICARLAAYGSFDQRWIAAAERNLALRRLGSALDVANAVAFLLSEQASWITGQTPMVDGGYALSLRRSVVFVGLA